jgi:hypothetical protein
MTEFSKNTDNQFKSKEVDESHRKKAEYVGVYIAKSKIASDILGTDLDLNKAGNIYETLEKAAQPEDPQNTEAYNNSEGFTDYFEELPDFQTAVADRDGNGVQSNPDGTFNLRHSGEQHVVNNDGVPTDRK